MVELHIDHGPNNLGDSTHLLSSLGGKQPFPDQWNHVVVYLYFDDILRGGK